VTGTQALAAGWRERLGRHTPRAVHLPGFTLKPSSVLMPLLEESGEPHFLFTRRPLHLRSHPGQISFPGGGQDAADPSPLHTALREAEEELGLPAAAVEVLGQLDELPTPTGYRVRPFLGVVAGGLTLQPNAEEVAEVLKVPVRLLADPARRRTELHEVPQLGRAVEVDYLDVGQAVIWGATARILRNLFELSAGLPAFEALRPGAW
jgi:8-oxo-dGTP pyrophosphatase MutT (NUDIX family)